MKMWELSMGNSCMYLVLGWRSDACVQKRKYEIGWLKNRIHQLCVEPQRASPQGGLTACFESMGSSDGPVWPLSSPPSHNICISTHSLLPESQQKRLYLCTIFSHAYDWKVLSMGLQCAFQSSEFKKKNRWHRKPHQFRKALRRAPC